MKMYAHYAKLLLERGVNINQGQDLFINAPLDAYALVEAIVESAYRDFKSGHVHVNWQTPKLNTYKYRHATDDVLKDVPDYILSRYNIMLKRQAAVINLSTVYPELSQMLDAKKLQQANRAIGQKTRGFEQKILSELKWCVAPVPSISWAKKVYPDNTEEDAYQNLQEALQYIVRLDQSHPVSAWDEHLNRMKKRTNLLNEKHFKTLKYKGHNIDLEVTLPNDHLWLSAASAQRNNEQFIPKIPNEQIFTSPHKYGTKGKLKTTLPMHFRGQKIEPFSVEFEDGRAVNIQSPQKQILSQLMRVDEGAAYLGKVALVSEDTPVANLKTLFYNNLIDENLSSHFAFGNSYVTALKDGLKMDDQRRIEKGLNKSRIHLDFMIGSNDLSVIGIDYQDQEIVIMEQGLFSGEFA